MTSLIIWTQVTRLDSSSGVTGRSVGRPLRKVQTDQCFPAQGSTGVTPVTSWAHTPAVRRVTCSDVSLDAMIRLEVRDSRRRREFPNRRTAQQQGREDEVDARDHDDKRVELYT